MCKYCNPEESDCCVWIEPLDKTWYLEVQTGEWNTYEDDWFYEIVYGIKYCPFCGKELKNER